MAELGSVVVTFGDLLDAANFGAKKLRLVNQNVQQRNKWRLMWEDFSSARFWCHPCNRHKKANVVVSAEVGRGDSEGLIACTFEVGNLIRTDWATKSDPVVCTLLFDDAMQVHLLSIVSLLFPPSFTIITPIQCLSCVCEFVGFPALRAYGTDY
jgi:hypothetical protein